MTTQKRNPQNTIKLKRPLTTERLCSNSGSVLSYLVTLVDLETDLPDAVSDAAEETHHSGARQSGRARSTRQIALHFQEVNEARVSL